MRRDDRAWAPDGSVAFGSGKMRIDIAEQRIPSG
jgi:hypothetical protein